MNEPTLKQKIVMLQIYIHLLKNIEIVPIVVNVTDYFLLNKAFAVVQNYFKQNNITYEQRN